jgi:hypothetical protein
MGSERASTKKGGDSIEKGNRIDVWNKRRDFGNLNWLALPEEVKAHPLS